MLLILRPWRTPRLFSLSTICQSDSTGTRYNLPIFVTLDIFLKLPISSPLYEKPDMVDVTYTMASPALFPRVKTIVDGLANVPHPVDNYDP